MGPSRFLKVFDERDKNRIGNKIWQVDISHYGGFDI